MGIRRFVGLAVVVGSMAVAPAASANLVLLPLLPSLPVKIGAVVPVPVAQSCPQVPGTSMNQCVVPPIAGVGITCASGEQSVGSGTNRANGCTVTAPGLAVACGDSGASGPHGGGSFSGCAGLVGATPLSVGCSYLLGQSGEGAGCGVTPVGYSENQGQFTPGGSVSVLSLGGLRVVCVSTNPCTLVSG